MLGDNGSRVIEIAASWTIIMIVTGMYLWLGKGGKFSFAGMVYPRLQRKDRAFWKDIHAVTGFWIAFFTIFLLISGLPWSASWGGLLKNLRQWSTPTVIHQDWTTSSHEEAHHQQHLFEQAQQHHMHNMAMQSGHHDTGMNQTTAMTWSSLQTQTFNDLVKTAPHLDLQPPVTARGESKILEMAGSVMYWLCIFSMYLAKF